MSAGSQDRDTDPRSALASDPRRRGECYLVSSSGASDYLPLARTQYRQSCDMAGSRMEEVHASLFPAGEQNSIELWRVY